MKKFFSTNNVIEMLDELAANKTFCTEPYNFILFIRGLRIQNKISPNADTKKIDERVNTIINRQ